MTFRGAAAAASAALVVPLVVTGLFRLGSPDRMVLVVCAVVAVGLFFVKVSVSTWLAVGWTAGCVLWAAALAYILDAASAG